VQQLNVVNEMVVGGCRPSDVGRREQVSTSSHIGRTLLSVDTSSLDYSTDETSHNVSHSTQFTAG